MQPDEWFRQRYAVRLHELRAEISEGVNPVFIRLGPDMFRFHDHVRERETVLCDRYLRLKEVCHMPVAVFLCLSPMVGRPIETEELGQMQRVRAWLGDRDEEGDALAVVEATSRFVDDVLDERTVLAKRLLELGREIRPPLRSCIEEATRLEVLSLHDIVSRWTEDFDAQAWKRLHVVVCASHQARYKEPTKLYFQRLLGEEHGVGAQGERQIVYAENAESVDDAVELLAIHLADRELGAFFLDSPMAMQENILGDAAREAIGALFSPAPRERSG